MTGRVCGALLLIALAASVFTGRGEASGVALLEGVGRAVTLTLSLTGLTVFWSGMMAVLREAGVIRRLSRLLRPLLRLFFPDAYRTGMGAEEICANVAANLLGLGNAATPLGLAAMQKLSSIGSTGDMITLAVMNTASFSLLPTTVIALRRQAGSPQPFRVLAAVWIVSALTSLFALTLTRLCRLIPERRGKREGRVPEPQHTAADGSRRLRRRVRRGGGT